MKVLIITSCTGQKKVSSNEQLLLSDFKKGEKHIKRKESKLSELMMPAGDIYTGQQHVRLTRGLENISKNKPLEYDLFILSAGYGLISASQEIAPYEATFMGMKKSEIVDWSNQINVPQDFQDLISKTYDLVILLLGDDYFAACQVNKETIFSSKTIMLCGSAGAKRIKKLELENLTPVILSNKEAKRFSCGLVALKGEITSRIISWLKNKKDDDLILLKDSDTILNLLEAHDPIIKTIKNKKAPFRENPAVDKVIKLTKEWKTKSHRKHMRYFIPDWDDQVDPDFDFETETHSGGTGGWGNQVYAHQMFDAPNYDGILISKIVAEQSKKKKERINRLGVHRHLRIPKEMPVMGDCGAFGYIAEEVPPYTTEEMLEYYTRLDFDYGVSLDHLIVSAFESQKKERYKLTIDNAAEFIKEHKKLGLDWTPIGAVQGWSPETYRDAAEQYIKMGYKYIALGGLVRSTSIEILKIVTEVVKVVPKEVDIHLFGLARLNVLKHFSDMGVTSVDSASHLRRAWLGAKDNYWTVDGKKFAAFRIPEVGGSYRAKRIVNEGRASLEQIDTLEKGCLKAVRGYDKGKGNIEDVLDLLDEYNHLISDNRSSLRDAYRNTLELKPWKKCPCDICKKDGIEVVIFRGNNRNRRRGFHNTYSFFNMFQKVLLGEMEPPSKKPISQLTMFK